MDNEKQFAKTNYENKLDRDALLSMLQPRLELAKELLSSEGVIFCSIDDKNQAHVKLLMDKIFQEKNFINNFMWLHGKGKKDAWSRTMQQYILAYAKDKERLKEWKDVDYANYEFTNPDNDPKGKWFSGSLSFSEERSNHLHPNYYPIISPTGVKWTRQWQISKEQMNELINNGDISWGDPVKKDGVPRQKIRPSKIDIIPCNIIDKCGTTKSAENDLKNILPNCTFNYPKPVALIKKLIKITQMANNINVLDFFAGSGTTGQAVLQLNKEDNGNRKFILCVNNSGNSDEICKERLRRVMTGKTKEGKSDFPWIKNNKPLGSSLGIYNIKEASKYTDANCLIDQIDERDYDLPKFKTEIEKIEWVCDNFKVCTRGLKKP